MQLKENMWETDCRATQQWLIWSLWSPPEASFDMMQLSAKH